MKPNADHPFVSSSHPAPSKWHITEKKRHFFFLRNNTRKTTYLFQFKFPYQPSPSCTHLMIVTKTYHIMSLWAENFCLLNIMIHELTNRFSRITTGKINLKNKIFTLLGCYTGWLVISYQCFRTPYRYRFHLVTLSDPWRWDQQAVPNCQ